jgi:hypothetical protein
MNKLWRIAGTSKSGNAIRITVRAADYFEARTIGRKARIEIHDIVLVTDHEENRISQGH